MPADLHCHTKLSDGSVSIEELLQMAKRKSIPAIAITDHDTFAGAKRAVISGKNYGIEVIPGAEFSTIDSQTGNKVHILCYFCKNTDRLEGLCKHISDKRRRASLYMIQKAMKLYPISAEMVMRRAQGSTNIYKQHIMHAIIDAGCTDSFYGDVYNTLFNEDTGIAKYKISYPETRSVIKQIHEAGGVAVMAHPCLYNGLDSFELLAKEKLLDGVEVYHPRNIQGDSEKIQIIADKYNLIKTGGSDFHGMYTKHMTQIGECMTEDFQLDLLKKRSTQINKTK